VLEMEYITPGGWRDIDHSSILTRLHRIRIKQGDYTWGSCEFNEFLRLTEKMIEKSIIQLINTGMPHQAYDVHQQKTLRETT
jgi:hypothetical protein